MSNRERQIIFETITGSHLYGTSRPESDMDFMGVFIPAMDELLGLQNPPKEWSQNEKNSSGLRNNQDDIDRKYYSVSRFLSLLAEGQSSQLEMLFAPRKLWQHPLRATRGAWSEIYKNREMFIAQSSVYPFIGFAKAQAHKATIKGENLNTIRHLIEKMTDIKNENPHILLQTVKDLTVKSKNDNIWYFLGEKVKVEESEYRAGVFMKSVVIAGRKFEFTQQIRNVLPKLRDLEDKYGTRAEAAAEKGYDFKSLMHAYRLLFQANMILETGALEFPLPSDKVKFLLKIRSGEYEADYFDEIDAAIDDISQKKLKSGLPVSVDRDKVNEMCVGIMKEHFRLCV